MPYKSRTEPVSKTKQLTAYRNQKSIKAEPNVPVYDEAGLLLGRKFAVKCSHLDQIIKAETTSDGQAGGVCFPIPALIRVIDMVISRATIGQREDMFARRAGR